MAEANVKLRVDSGDAVRKLTNVNTAATKLNRTVDATTRKTATATANIQRFGISFRSVIGPVVAITGAATLFNRSLSKFAEREADVKVLTSQLTRLGATSTQIKDLKKAADELGDATLFSQDDFVQSFNVLSSFRAIAVSSFTEVSEVAANIAQVMGTDVKSATVQLAKALEDPTRGLTALSRSGITFNKSQTETIKNLVKSGNLLDAQALILETVKGQYDGAARAAGTGFAGAVDLLAENTDDLTEALGKGLEPAAAAVTNGLANLVKVVSEIPTPAGQAALAIGTATAAFYALKTANDLLIASKLGGFLIAQIGLFKAFGAQIYLTAAATGFKTKAVIALKAALSALPWVAAIVAVTALVKQQYELVQAVKEYNTVVEKGTVEELTGKILELETRLDEANKKTVTWYESMLDFVLGTDGASKSVDGLIGKIDELKKRRAELKIQTTDTDPTQGAALDMDAVNAFRQKLQLEDKLKELTEPPSSGEDLAALAQKQIQSLRDQASLAAALNEEEKRRVQFNIDLREIAENAKGFAEEDVHAQIAARIELEEKVNAANAYNQALENTAKIEEKARKARKKAEEDAEKARKNDPLVRMQEELDKLVSKETQALHAATSIGNAFTNAFGDVISGTKSVSEAGADMLKSIASDFLAMAKKIIAQQLAMILYQTILKALGGPAGLGGGGGGTTPPATMPDSVGLIAAEGAYSSGGFKAFNQGGVVSKPTLGLVGEGGEPEYIIPQSKMRESMSRYSRGSRGGGVIPDNRGGSASEDGGTAVAAPIDVRYTVERINSVDYVTADQFQSGMQSAAAQGAQRGEQNTLKRLQMSGSTRRRLGM